MEAIRSPDIAFASCRWSSKAAPLDGRQSGPMGSANSHPERTSRLGRRPGRTDKVSESVSRYVIQLLFDGSLRTGDRIDRDEIAEVLGISVSPVQEALRDLERDGIVHMQYQRGAFVATFDQESVLERHEVYGQLSAIASARVAVEGQPELISELRSRYAKMRQTADEPEVFDDHAWEFRSRN